MHGLSVVIGQDRNTLLVDYIAGVNLMLEEKGGYASLLVTVYDGPVDGGGSAVLREQGTVEIEGAQAWHVPYYFREHTEGYYYLEIGLKGGKGFKEGRIFQLFRLKYGNTLLYRVFLDGTALQHTAVTTHRFIRHGDYTYYIITLLYKTAQGELRKFRSAHKYYPQVFLLHNESFLLLREFKQYAAV
jgi:hypothetical protein